MRKKDKLDQMLKVLSEERLKKAYGLTEDILEALSYKAWNLALCASLYPILQIVEICLRNSIHNAISEKINNKNWLMSKLILETKEQEALQKTILNLVEVSRASDHNHLISELTFGFWTSLLTPRYERKIWHPLITKIFPYIPRNTRTRNFIYKRFMLIRQLRNRVFHHQRIYQIQDLLQQKNAIIEAIEWIEPCVNKFVKPLDQFEEVYNRGVNYYRNKINIIVSSEE